MSAIEPQVVRLTLEEAKEILEGVDWSVPDRFTQDEQGAVVCVATHYMTGSLTREECASILHVSPDKLPEPWDHLKPS